MDLAKCYIMQDLKGELKKYSSLLFLNPYRTLLITALWTTILSNERTTEMLKLNCFSVFSATHSHRKLKPLDSVLPDNHDWGPPLLG